MSFVLLFQSYSVDYNILYSETISLLLHTAFECARLPSTKSASCKLSAWQYLFVVVERDEDVLVAFGPLCLLVCAAV